MKQFKSTTDWQQLDKSNLTYPAVADLVHNLIANYEGEGYVYDPKADVDSPLTDIPDGDTRLTDLFWEGAPRSGHTPLPTPISMQMESIRITIYPV